MSLNLDKNMHSQLILQSIFVSIILCNYNYEKYIEEAIQSVLNQTYSNFELIVVDDGSTDNSREIISAFKDGRIHCIFQENRGQAAAFNAGVAQARGNLIAFLDSDDVWKPEKLEKVVQTFKENNFEYSIVQHNLEWIDENSRPLGKLWPGLPAGVKDVFKAYFAQNHTGFFCTTSGTVCRQSDLQKIFPLDESWKICADVALTRPLAFFGKIYTLKESLGYYRVHNLNNWMKSDKQQQVIENHKKYNDYTNQWLAKLGYVECLDFTKSVLYQREYIQKLPKFHPRQLWHKMTQLGHSIRNL